jgi:cytochrome c-type biogenesis protein CcmH/NrfF
VRLVAVLLIVLLTPATAVACPKTSLGDVSDEVMCLQCGVPLNVSAEAPAARRQRAFIQEQVDQCKSKQEIKDALVAQFGTAVLAEPQDDTAWLVPAIGFGGGAVLVAAAAWTWRRRRARAAAAEGPAAALNAADSARLDADLGRYDL